MLFLPTALISFPFVYSSINSYVSLSLSLSLSFSLSLCVILFLSFWSYQRINLLKLNGFYMHYQV